MPFSSIPWLYPDQLLDWLAPIAMMGRWYWADAEAGPAAISRVAAAARPLVTSNAARCIAFLLPSLPTVMKPNFTDIDPVTKAACFDVAIRPRRQRALPQRQGTAAGEAAVPFRRRLLARVGGDADGAAMVDLIRARGVGGGGVGCDGAHRCAMVEWVRGVQGGARDAALSVRHR